MLYSFVISPKQGHRRKTKKSDQAPVWERNGNGGGLQSMCQGTWWSNLSYHFENGLDPWHFCRKSDFSWTTGKLLWYTDHQRVSRVSEETIPQHVNATLLLVSLPKSDLGKGLISLISSTQQKIYWRRWWIGKKLNIQRDGRVETYPHIPFGNSTTSVLEKNCTVQAAHFIATTCCYAIRKSVIWDDKNSHKIILYSGGNW